MEKKGTFWRRLKVLIIFVFIYLSHIWLLCADERLNDFVGSAYYVAPEVLIRRIITLFFVLVVFFSALYFNFSQKHAFNITSGTKIILYRVGTNWRHHLSQYKHIIRATTSVHLKISVYFILKTYFFYLTLPHFQNTHLS